MMRSIGLLIFLPALCLGQATFGTITGTVTDSTGAVVPNTEVVVANEGTNLTRRVTTGSDGNYAAPSLNSGTYRVHARRRVSRHMWSAASAWKRCEQFASICGSRWAK